MTQNSGPPFAIRRRTSVSNATVVIFDGCTSTAESGGAICANRLAIPDNERVAGIPDLVDKVENQLLHEEGADDGHHDRYDEMTRPPAHQQGQNDEERDKAEPNDRTDPLVE